MSSEKFENLLNLSLLANNEELEKSMELLVGVDESDGMWELVIRHTAKVKEALDKVLDYYTFTGLINNYAILNMPKKDISKLSKIPEIIYVEKAKKMYFAQDETVKTEKLNACITAVNSRNFGLTGKNVFVAIIDSGIELTDENRESIFAIWDQTNDKNPPPGYNMGSYYSREDIQTKSVEVTDESGHGTTIFKIIKNICPDAQFLIVKLGRNPKDLYPGTTRLMQGVDFCIKTAQKEGKAIAVNISYGNTYGAHDGTSIIETYLNQAADYGRCVIVCGAGNEGISAGHTELEIEEGKDSVAVLAVTEFETKLNLQIWKKYQDEFELEIISPTFERVVLTGKYQGAYRYSFLGVELLIYYASPLPYSINQEIYIDFIPEKDYITSGEWRFVFKGKKIKYGKVNLWLPVMNSVNKTAFLNATPNLTITIPATADKVISVGAYNDKSNIVSEFSGRGYTYQFGGCKPELVAPGEDILIRENDGTYTNVSGTSFAAPFVTASAALLMEWGIVNGNDIYMYGEKVKAYLINGTKELPGYSYPNETVGYGKLCLNDSIPK